MRNSLWIIVLVIFFQGCGGQSVEEGDELFNQDKYEEAIEVYSKYLETNPGHIKSLYNRGRAHQEIGDKEKAEADFLAVLEIEENNISAHLSLSRLYYEKGLYTKALIHADKAIDINENSADGHFLAGRAKHHAGYLESALESYNLAIKINKDYGEAYLYRGALKIHFNQTKSACGDLVRAEALGVQEARSAKLKYCQ